MNGALFLRGFLIGLSIAAPVGPIGVLCIRRTLASGRLAGFITGMGAASADAIYGAVAGFGLTAITSLLVGQQFWFRLLGGIFLVYLGVKTFMSKPARSSASSTNQSLAVMYVSTLFLTLTNPATILSFIGV
ncbi:MAG TPA: LysE family transporter, partial [Verrucomicrobiae bacterium]|nr:LysE family transporter [Verrucomicrobiae bacterium]